ncbi:MAG: hypothetical protein KBA53_06325, partial [Thermoclostridium sp.]|nr:hypothetical protein [Thermoclostridium sp.]
MKGNTSRFISTILSVMLLISGFQIHSPFMYVNAAEGDPEPPPDPSFPTGIDSGRDFTVAWSDGRVAAWGNNADHQCDVPVKLRGVTAASAGAEHVIALKQDGTVVAWGDNEYGQCDAPAGLSNVIAVSAGGYHSLALKADGTVVAWGMNLNGQCNVPEVSNITAIAAGGYHSLALTADKTVVSWGYDGNGSWSTAGLTDIIAIAAPWNHSLAIKSDGTVVAWGDNFGGQLDVPAGLSNVVAVSGSLCNSLALKSDGTVVAWGGWYGGLTPDMFQPPVGLTQVTAISSEDGGCVALKTDGTIASWGDTAGHLTNGSEIIPVPRIVNAQLAADNSYMDITVNESVYGQGSVLLSPSDFQVVFNSNGGDATSAGITSIQRTNGDAITTAENELRFLLQIEGNPTGEETISIKPASGSSIFDSFGAAMDAQESTDPIQLNAVTAKLLSAQMGTDNSYFDITFNMGIYGDGG